MCYCINQQYHLTRQNKHFWHSCHMLVNLMFWCSNQSFGGNIFFFVVCSKHLYAIAIYHVLKDILWNSLPWLTHILFGFLPKSFKILWNALSIIAPFLSFNGITQAHVLKRSIPHNKNLKTLLYFLFHGISVKLAIKKCANIISCWLDIAPLPVDYLSNNL